MHSNLHDLLIHSAASTPDSTALVGPRADVCTYGALDSAANHIALELRERGVRRGDRVAIFLPKTTFTVAAMQAVLRLGAAYVPVDPSSPARRAQMILRDCEVSAVVTLSGWAANLLTGDLEGMPLLALGDTADDLRAENLPKTQAPFEAEKMDASDLAFILCTSGSTGRPKGVCISHRNSLAFVTWAVEMLNAGPSARFSNHAPFHFDLSVLDLYAAFMVGAQVHIIPEEHSFAAERLVELIRERELTFWYSVPSALKLMLEHGGLLSLDPNPLEAIMFAGEPFAIQPLRALRRRWPDLRLLNLYGPTETNVCTAYEVGEIDDDRTIPVPIGTATCGDRVWAVTDEGTVAGAGEEGELMVEGPTVMLGYWGKPVQGDAPYATGDIVRVLDDGNLLYVGRRDHMVKIRGFRIELGEIEAALLTHDAVDEVAVVTVTNDTGGKIVAFIVSNDAALSLIDCKRHCAEHLPRYMIVDEVKLKPRIPRTATGKVDRQTLTQWASSN